MTDLKSDFVDLATYSLARPAPKSVRGTLIKACDIECTGTHTVDVEAHSAHQPAIITHREGDVIKAIEVMCACGASTTISLEY
jgi:hypothetical protein